MASYYYLVNQLLRDIEPKLSEFGLTGIVTDFELRVLTLLETNSIDEIARKLQCRPKAVYDVFERIRKRRKKFQVGELLFSKLSENPKYAKHLTPD